MKALIISSTQLRLASPTELSLKCEKVSWTALAVALTHGELPFPTTKFQPSFWISDTISVRTQRAKPSITTRSKELKGDVTFDELMKRTTRAGHGKTQVSWPGRWPLDLLGYVSSEKFLNLQILSQNAVVQIPCLALKWTWPKYPALSRLSWMRKTCPWCRPKLFQPSATRIVANAPNKKRTIEIITQPSFCGRKDEIWSQSGKSCITFSFVCSPGKEDQQPAPGDTQAEHQCFESHPKLEICLQHLEIWFHNWRFVCKYFWFHNWRFVCNTSTFNKDHWRITVSSTNGKLPKKKQ